MANAVDKYDKNQVDTNRLSDVQKIDQNHIYMKQTS